MFFGKITETMHRLVESALCQCDYAVDATMGNGNDTLFLSHFVGGEGQVYAFDIQETALEVTKKRLEEEGVTNVRLIHDGHEHMSAYVQEADLIMFNLGYLPKGDHSIVTRVDTTITAITRGLSVLNEGGLLTIISYYGHPGGMEENQGLKEFLKQLSHKAYDVMEINAFNKGHNPPTMYIVHKKNNVK